jgi:hypothetical protein
MQIIEFSKHAILLSEDARWQRDAGRIVKNMQQLNKKGPLRRRPLQGSGLKATRLFRSTQHRSPQPR